MKSEFKPIEVFITRDGEEFLDEDFAATHEQKLDSLDKLNTMLLYISHGYHYEVEQYEDIEGNTTKLIVVENPNFQEDRGNDPNIVYEIKERF